VCRFSFCKNRKFLGGLKAEKEIRLVEPPFFAYSSFFCWGTNGANNRITVAPIKLITLAINNKPNK